MAAISSSPAQEGADLSALQTVPVTRGFERVQRFIESYNAGASEGKKVDAQEIVAKLKDAGAVTDQILKAMSQSQITDATGLPAIVATALHKDLQGLDSPLGTHGRRVSRLVAGTMAIEDLFARYNPDEVGSAIAGELLGLAKTHIGRNPKVITFHADGKVNGELSFKLFQDAIKGDPDIDQVSQDGKLFYTYRIGERVDDVVSIHPITGENLRSNQVSTDGFDWSNVPDNVRFVFRHAIETGELNARMSRRDMAYYYQTANSPQGFTSLCQEFPQAARRYSEAERIGQQPAIKRVRGSDGDPTGDIVSSLTKRR